MPIIRARGAAEFANEAADWVTERLRDDPRSVLALPTGNTPIGLYAELVARARADALSLAEARIFDLDEYAGVAPADAHSYAAFLHRHLIDPLRLAPGQVCLLRGDAADLRAECRRYDAALAACGGIDLCVLGLGVNGHIAFNEPGSAWNRRTHVVSLAPSTRAAHAAQAACPWSIPAFGITLGIRSLRQSRHVLLLIAGAGKTAARDTFYRGLENLDWPVTSLVAHPSVTVIELCAPGERP